MIVKGMRRGRAVAFVALSHIIIKAAVVDQPKST